MLGLTLRDLSPQVGRNFSSMSKFERAKMEPSLDLLRVWCEALGLRLEVVVVDASTPSTDHLTDEQRAAAQAMFNALATLSDAEARHLRGMLELLAGRRAREG